MEVLKREIEKFQRDDGREAALDIVKQYDLFVGLMPQKMQPHAQRLLLRAFVYCREKIKDPFRPESFVSAVFKAAEFGLAIDGRLAYALPFDETKGTGPKTLHFVPDYKGMIAVAKWKGVVKDAYARVVRAKDQFKVWEDDIGSHFRWEPFLDGNRGAARGAFCVLVFPDSQRRCEWMPEEDILQIRRLARTQKVWNQFEDEMRKKCPIRRAMKLCQDEPAIAELIEADDAGYNLDGAIDVQALDLEADTKDVAPPEGPPKEPAASSPARRSRRRRKQPEPSEAPPAAMGPASDATLDTYRRGWLAMCEEGDNPSETIGWKQDDCLTEAEAQQRISNFARLVKAYREARK